MCFAIGAIVFDLQEEGALVAPHIVEYIGDEVTGDGDEGDGVAFARRLAALDTLVHLLVLGGPLAQVEGKVDRRIAAVRGALLGDAFGVEDGGTGDVLASGDAEEAGHVCAIGEATDVTDLAHQCQGIADASANGCTQ